MSPQQIEAFRWHNAVTTRHINELRVALLKDQISLVEKLVAGAHNHSRQPDEGSRVNKIRNGNQDGYASGNESATEVAGTHSHSRQPGEGSGVNKIRNGNQNGYASGNESATEGDQNDSSNVLVRKARPSSDPVGQLQNQETNELEVQTFVVSGGGVNVTGQTVIKDQSTPIDKLLAVSNNHSRQDGYARGNESANFIDAASPSSSASDVTSAPSESPYPSPSPMLSAY
uniref:Uncharacterized protein n=1 Tax=Arundo donax TaxID=35708 RepID=A0A0A9AW34_ARUDO